MGITDFITSHEKKSIKRYIVVKILTAKSTTILSASLSIQAFLLYLFCDAACCWLCPFAEDCLSVWARAREGELLLTCRYRSTPQLSAAPCSSWPRPPLRGCDRRWRKRMNQGAWRRSPQHWLPSEWPGSVTQRERECLLSVQLHSAILELIGKCGSTKLDMFLIL